MRFLHNCTVDAEDPDKMSSSGIQAHREPHTSAVPIYDLRAASNEAAAAETHPINIYFSFLLRIASTFLRLSSAVRIPFSYSLFISASSVSSFEAVNDFTPVSGSSFVGLLLF